MTGEPEVSKYIVFGLDGDPSVPCLAAAHNTVDMGPFIATQVGNGNPYFAFETFPMVLLLADELGANFNSAPLASDNYQANRLAVSEMYANPPVVGETDDGTNVVWKIA